MLKSSSALLLGMIRGGFSSGYAIKKAIDGMRTGAFWATTFAQIYPELARLDADGYIVGHDDSQGARRRIAYTVTPAGEEAFAAWLRHPDQPPIELRDEGLVRLGMSDALSDAELRGLLGHLREREERQEREFREQILPTAEAIGAQGLRGPQLVARMGVDYHVWAAAFFARLEAEVGSSDPPPAAAPPSAD